MGRTGMERKANDLCRNMVSGAIILFFGISIWMIFHGRSREEAYLIFDIVSVWLMILVVFWVLVVEKDSRERNQQP